MKIQTRPVFNGKPIFGANWKSEKAHRRGDTPCPLISFHITSPQLPLLNSWRKNEEFCQVPDDVDLPRGSWLSAAAERKLLLWWVLGFYKRIQIRNIPFLSWTSSLKPINNPFPGQYVLSNSQGGFQNQQCGQALNRDWCAVSWVKKPFRCPQILENCTWMSCWHCILEYLTPPESHSFTPNVCLVVPVLVRLQL